MITDTRTLCRCVRDKEKTWDEVYASPITISELLENIAIHKELIEEVVNEAPVRVIEVGCGGASLAIFLSYFSFNVVAVDNNDEVLEIAKKSCVGLNGKVYFQKSDAFNLPFKDKYFDVSFSQGVIEHFSDVQIVKFLKEQLRVSKKVIFSAPSRFYNHKDFGNERLFFKHEWEKLLSDFDIQLSKYYYRIRTKRNFMLKLPLMYMAKIK